MLRFWHIAVGVYILAIAVFIVGAFYASLEHISTVELGAVTGLVTFHGRPQSNLCVDFVPVAGGRGSEGRTDQQGHYQAIYTTTKAGALVGQQKVIVSVPESWDSSRNTMIPRKPLLSADVEVHSGANQFDFDLAN